MKIFNTLTRSKEEFVPINSNIVNMYVCGPTVYDLFHIGNGRTFIFFDIVRRYLEYKGYKVKYVQNFTDIDDKIINKGISLNKDIDEISSHYIDEYYKDADALNIKRASINPRATHNLSPMIDLITNLIDEGFAYEVDGEVYFSVRSFKDYGRLFGQDIDSLKSGSRIKVNDKKRDALDFILWKKSKENEPYYDSPWGKGRPGWHTECSSMIHKYFKGETIDIHGGGFDLIFPHHENEIAQIEALKKKPLTKYWMHCSFLNMNDEKMSKSLGNFLTSRELLDEFSPSVIRFFIASVHYRTTLSFSYEYIKSCEKALYRINNTYNLLLSSEGTLNGDNSTYIKDYYEKFISKMDDDFNTSDASSVIFELIKYVNKNINELSKDDIKECIKIIEDFYLIIGIDKKDLKEEETILPKEVLDKVNKRHFHKKDKEYEKADLVRSDLLEMGFILEDIKEGVRVIDLNTKKVLSTITSFERE